MLILPKKGLLQAFFTVLYLCTSHPWGDANEGNLL